MDLEDFCKRNLSYIFYTFLLLLIEEDPLYNSLALSEVLVGKHPAFTPLP